jgi:hypothetical protein
VNKLVLNYGDRRVITRRALNNQGRWRKSEFAGIVDFRNPNAIRGAPDFQGGPRPIPVQTTPFHSGQSRVLNDVDEPCPARPNKVTDSSLLL